jgi:membrane protease subunit (stomatin/prohibitin family)
MGLFNFLGKQFIDVIAWTENSEGVLSYRYPMQDREIQNGAVLTVDQSQQALFVNEGRIADRFGPGRYKLSTNTLPLLTNLNNWDKAFASPFKSDVYFFSTREQIDQKWGTPHPITFKDPAMGAIRLRANGNYSYVIKEPEIFYKKISGSREIYTREELSGQLLGVINTNLANFLASSGKEFIQMAANQLEFSKKLLEAMSEPLANYGLEIKSFFVQSLALPEEVEKMIDQMGKINLVGDLKRYAQFQAAESISTAAGNPGMAGSILGVGVGAELGKNIMGAISGGGGAFSNETDPMQTIEKLHALFTKGVISKEEFETKKADILKKIQ